MSGRIEIIAEAHSINLPGLLRGSYLSASIDFPPQLVALSSGSEIVELTAERSRQLAAFLIEQAARIEEARS